MADAGKGGVFDQGAGCVAVLDVGGGDVTATSSPRVSKRNVAFTAVDPGFRKRLTAAARCEPDTVGSVLATSTFQKLRSALVHAAPPNSRPASRSRSGAPREDRRQRLR